MGAPHIFEGRLILIMCYHSTAIDAIPPPCLFPWSKLQLPTHCLRDRHGGWDCINCRAVVAHNQNEPSFKNIWSSQRLSYINIFLHCLPLKWLRIVLLPSMSRAMKEADIAPFAYGDPLRYLGLLILMSICSVWKREDFWSVTLFDKYSNPCPYCLG